MEKVRSKDGTLIACERTGNGPPLVMVHGTSADHTRWARVLPTLQRHFTVCAMDRRGRGGSGDASPYAIEREYEDVAAVVDSLPGPVDLFGHSYGALCSLEASLLSRNIRRLVLYEPVFDVGLAAYPEGLLEQLQAHLEKGDRESVLVTFFREAVNMPDHELDRLRADPSWAGRLAAAHTVPREFADADYILVPERFRGMKTATLLLKGGASPISLTRPTDELAKVLPNCRVIEMPGQQHIAMNTAPELFCSEIIGFLSAQSLSGAAPAR